jgi:mono/diheme cytochrome c family protein
VIPAVPQKEHMFAGRVSSRTPRTLIGMRAGLTLMATAIAAGTLAGCGSSAAPPQPVSGAKIFSQQCSTCHSLIGNESRHRPGGDLIGYRLTRHQLELQIRQMPVKRPLTPSQLAAVVEYVWSVQLNARGARIKLPVPARRR